MALEIAFSRKADKDFETILNYLLENFGSQSADQFKILIDEFVTLVLLFPEIGSLELADRKIRGFVAHHRLKIFYRINGERIVILRLFDTRQHPGKKF